MNRALVEVRRYSGPFERHRHAYHQIILPCSGCMDVETEGHVGRVTGGVGAFMAAGSNHSCSARPTDAFVVLNAPVHRARPHLGNAAIPVFFSIGRDLQGLLDYMIGLSTREQLPASLLAAWSSLVLDRLAGYTPPSDIVEIGLRRATAFMKSRLADPIRVADIAKAAGMSLTRLHAAFQYRRSTTPHAHLISLRLDAAERLLADPRLSIAEVAVQTGHADQSALTRAMRRARGATPADVRQRLLGNAKGDA
jgi:AraC-like DNA-binding protein